MFEIFQFDFMARALIAGLCIGVIAPAVGMFLVVRRYSHLADTLAHVSLGGAALGAAAHLPQALASFTITLAAALGIERLRQTKKLHGEAVLSLFLSGGLAFALILFSVMKGTKINLGNFLFGSIATVTTLEVSTTLAVSIAVLTIIGALYKKFFLVAFDEDLARVNGINPGTINMVFMTAAAITITVSMRAVGILLVGSLMVIPVLTALQLKKGFRATHAASIIFSLTAVIAGIFLAYYFDIPSGAAIVSVSLLMFLLILILPSGSRYRSWCGRRRKN